jgi:hypothetical protein
MNCRRARKVLAHMSLAMLLTPCATAAADEVQIQQQLGQITRDVGELKASGSSEWSAVISALAGLAGAGVGAWGAMRGGKKTSEAQARQARDQLISQRRVDVYCLLFKHYADFSRDPLPQPLPSKARLHTLIDDMTEWYYKDGGGLVMSTLCQGVFLHTRKLLIVFADGIRGNSLQETEFLAVYHCCSRLRTALIYDVDGRRTLGGPSDGDAETNLTTFLKLEYSNDPVEAIQFFAAQQKADEAKSKQE